jgi:hypothetical protein
MEPRVFGRPLFAGFTSTNSNFKESKFLRKSPSTSILDALRPSNLRRELNRDQSLFAISAFTLVGALFLGGFFDSAAANTSCTNQANSSTGVTAAVVGTDCLVTFSGVRSHTWSVPTGVTTARLLIIGGGGGAGSGGGGAGGFYEIPNASLSSASYTIVVGAGGDESPNSSSAGSNGAASSFSNFGSAGGGGGGGRGSSTGSSGAG